MEIQKYYPTELPLLGVIKDEPNQAYHDNEAVSNSWMSLFRKRKYLFWKKYIKRNLPKEEKEKDYFTFGGAGHCLILEGQEEFEKRYMIEPVDAPKKPTKVQRDAAKPSALAIERIKFWENFKSIAQEHGKEILSQKQMRVLFYVNDSVEQNEIATALIAEIEPELTFRCNLGWTMLQVRLDGFIESCPAHLAEFLNEALANTSYYKKVEAGDTIAIDLKTCATLTAEDSGSYDKHVGEHGYYIQDRLYREVVERVTGKPLDHFFFIPTEKQEPFETDVRFTDPDDLALANEILFMDLTELKNCFRTKAWMSLNNGTIKSQSISSWHKSRAEMRIKSERARNE